MMDLMMNLAMTLISCINPWLDLLLGLDLAYKALSPNLEVPLVIVLRQMAPKRAEMVVHLSVLLLL